LLGDRVVSRSSTHRDLAGETFEEDQAPGVEITPFRDVFAAKLLGRGVGGRAEQLVGDRQAFECRSLAFRDEAAEAEIENHRVTACPGSGDHDVLGLEIAMNDASGVGTGERIQHLRHESRRFAEREPVLGVEDFAQRRPRDVVEHRIGAPVVQKTRIEQPYDVGVPQLRAQPRLAPETFGAIGSLGSPIVDHRWAEHLDGDVLARGDLTRAEHRAEAALAESGHDLVAWRAVLQVARMRIAFFLRHRVPSSRMPDASTSMQTLPVARVQAGAPVDPAVLACGTTAGLLSGPHVRYHPPRHLPPPPPPRPRAHRPGLGLAHPAR
jgi:hypothetical protein